MALASRSPSASTAPAVDRATLEDLIGKCPSNFIPLAELSQREFPALIASVRAALAAGNAAEACAVAHSIKGMLLNLCAANGSRLALELEEHVRHYRPAEASACVDALDAELARVAREIREMSAG